MSKVNNDRFLTLGRLKEVISYDGATGIFIWKVTMSPKAVAGSRAGTVRKTGYRIIIIDGEQHKASRLAWFYTHGEWPDSLIDHENTDRSDDRLHNLRPANNAENSWNIGLTVRNKSGFKGVCRSSHGAWQASIARHGEQFHLGSFQTPEEASIAYQRAAERLHGDFARFE